MPQPFPMDSTNLNSECLKLMAELRLRSERLGTSREQPGDMEAVIRLAHDLRGRATAFSLLAGLKQSAVGQVRL